MTRRLLWIKVPYDLFDHLQSFGNISSRRKTGKGIPKSSILQFLEKFLANNFALSMQRTTPLGRWMEEVQQIYLFITISNLSKVPWAKFLGSDGLFCFIDICKFGSFKDLFATIISLSKLDYRFIRFFRLIEMKKVITMNYGSSTSNWKPWRWVKLDMILQSGIYVLVPTWTHQQN